MLEYFAFSPFLLLVLAAVLWHTRRQRRLRQEMERFYDKYPAARGRYKPWI